MQINIVSDIGEYSDYWELKCETDEIVIVEYESNDSPKDENNQANK